eukprot:scpid105125/ scgid22887/ 
MARGLRSKRERRNRAAIRDKRSTWRREQLEKVLNSKDTPAMPVESVSVKDEDMAVPDPAVTAVAGAVKGEEAMGVDTKPKQPYIHFTHSERKHMKKKMRHQDETKRRKVMKKIMKTKLKTTNVT